MRIAGLQKLTLLDYPGEVACTVFMQGCNLRCPFCHNPELVVPELYQSSIFPSMNTSHSGGEFPSGDSPSPEEVFFDYLDRRRGKLSGVVVSGGEPTLYTDLPDFLARIRRMGYLVKLDTNGMRPEALRLIIDAGLVDYVAMDVKNSPEKYAQTCGVGGIAEGGGSDPKAPSSLWEMARESISLLTEGRVLYEFRTTIAIGLHTEADVEAMACQLRGARAWFLQQFTGGKAIVGDYSTGKVPKMRSPSPAEMEKMKEAAQAFVPAVSLRGV